MVTNGDGVPITQREHAGLSLLTARAETGALMLTWDASTFRVPEPAPDSPRIEVNIWGDRVCLPLAGPESSEWLSSKLGLEAHLAFMPDDVERPVNPRYATTGDRTALTDGYPLHLVGSGSMEDLNSRLDTPIGVERFRPNVYVEGPAPFAEDEWLEIRIGDCGFRVVKPCPRCTVTTIDPATGVRGKEPLQTLAGYRRTEGGVMFGQNVIHDGGGEIRVGDPVEVLSRRDVQAT